jgi:hypothetical protein
MKWWFVLLLIPLVAGQQRCRPICRRCRECHSDWDHKYSTYLRVNETQDDQPIPDNW